MHGRLFIAALGALVVPQMVAGGQPSTARSPAAARRAVERLLSTGANPAPPISSDDEHADAVAPVLTPRTTILFHDDDLPTTHRHDARYIVSEGRMFVLDSSPRRDLHQPMLRIRAVDGGQHIAFVIRSSLMPYGDAVYDGVLEIVFPAPTIFQPSIEVRRAWVAGRSVDATVVPRIDTGILTVQVPVRLNDRDVPDGTPRSVTVLVEGTLRLLGYDHVDPGTLEEPGPTYPGDPLANLASLSVGRDCRDRDELAKVVQAARSATAAAPDSYHKILAINGFVSSTLRYLQDSLHRSPGDILEERVGDCDDYTTLMIALLRALAIPCRPVRGFLFDFGALAAHTWVEAALPLAGDGQHWFICDPTLGASTDDEDEREIAVQLRTRAHLYPAQPLVALSALPAHHVTDILLNVAAPQKDHRTTPAELEGFVLEVVEGVARGFGECAHDLSRSSLLLQRELPLSPGSRYVIAERTITEGSSSLKTVLESNEGVAVELVAVGDGVDLGNAAEREVIEALRSAYEHLDWLLFNGAPAEYLLELTYSRDPHSDRLERVRLDFNRYLIQSHLGPILKRMRRAGLWTDQDAALLENLHHTAGGTNFYFLQELARRRVTDPEPLP